MQIISKRGIVLLKLADNTEINQVSLTGVRALVLLTLLLDEPKTFEEIKQAFINLKIMEPDSSDDIIRIDLNTLRNIGCEITRAGSKTNYKYKLLEHPFALKLSKDEIGVLHKVYNKMRSYAGIEIILKFDEFIRKIAAHVMDEEAREALCGISMLKDFDVKFVKDLLNDCKEKRILTLNYKKPGEQANEKVVSAQRLVVQNDNIFLYCYDFKRKESVTLNIKRILSIISRERGNNDINIKTIDVKFFLKNSCILDTDENEQIVENLPDGKLIIGKYYNEFLAIQRILSFGADCTVIEPTDFRAKVIEKLKSMRGVYGG